MISFKQFLNKPVSSVEKLSKKFDRPEDEINKTVDKGTEVEKEHTNKTSVAKQIAMKHVGEDPDYYKKLEKVEKPK